MLDAPKQRLQDLWVQNNRNRILITVGTGAVVILLLCGCFNLMGALFSGAVNGLFTSGPVEHPTAPVGTQQAANINPTFPLPKPTVYGQPNPPAQNVPSSGTPPPTATASPTPVITPTPPGGGGGGGPVTFTLSPDPSGQAFQAGATNQILLSGPQGKGISVSVYANNACLNMFVVLDNNGQATLSCMIPADLKGGTTNVSIQIVNGPFEQFSNIPIN